MRRRFWLAAVFMGLAVCACGSPEQPPAKPAPPAPGQIAAKSVPLPDPIVIETSEGRITLPHLAHAKKFQCNTCHSEVTPGKIAWDEKTAHAYCRDCHTRTGKGPVTCAECHKK